jgi:glycosyltransferase involved in cell wall biosynthesis
VPKLTVVFPAHNEQDRIGPTLTAYRRVCTDPTTEFLVALDACTDATEAVVADHAAQDPRVRIQHFPKLGKGGVLMETFRRADTDLIAFADADGATPPGELLRLVDEVENRELDLAIASRWHPAAIVPHARSRPLARRIASAGFALAVRRVFRLSYRDTQCGAKVIRGAAAQRLMPLMSSRDFLFDVDLLVTARALGMRVAEVPTIWVDQAGSKLQARRDAQRMAASLLRLWLHHRVLPVSEPPQNPAAGPGETAKDARRAA